MLEVIDDVLQAEERAKKILEEARQQASDIREKFADKEARVIKDAQAEADQVIRDGLAAAREAADTRVAEARSRFEEMEKGVETERAAAIDSAVSRAVDLVIRGEADA